MASTYDRLKKIVVEQLGVDEGEVNPEASFVDDLNADSLDLVELVMGLLGLFMAIWGARLVEATWHQSIAEFPFLSVGVTYLPIPVGGGVTALLVIERLLTGRFFEEPSGEGGITTTVSTE